MEQEDQAQELEGTAAFDYQLDRHGSKTISYIRNVESSFDYQLDRHCSKTSGLQLNQNFGLITS